MIVHDLQTTQTKHNTKQALCMLDLCKDTRLIKSGNKFVGIAGSGPHKWYHNHVQGDEGGECKLPQKVYFAFQQLLIP